MGRKGGGDACVHHWVVESPHGEKTVTGSCKRCGAERRFTIYLEDGVTNFDKPVDPAKAEKGTVYRSRDKRHARQRPRL